MQWYAPRILAYLHWQLQIGAISMRAPKYVAWIILSDIECQLRARWITYVKWSKMNSTNVMQSRSYKSSSHASRANSRLPDTQNETHVIILLVNKNAIRLVWVGSVRRAIQMRVVFGFVYNPIWLWAITIHGRSAMMPFASEWLWYWVIRICYLLQPMNGRAYDVLMNGDKMVIKTGVFIWIVFHFMRCHFQYLICTFFAFALFSPSPNPFVAQPISLHLRSPMTQHRKQSTTSFFIELLLPCGTCHCLHGSRKYNTGQIRMAERWLRLTWQTTSDKKRRGWGGAQLHSNQLNAVFIGLNLVLLWWMRTKLSRRLSLHNASSITLTHTRFGELADTHGWTESDGLANATFHKLRVLRSTKLTINIMIDDYYKRQNDHNLDVDRVGNNRYKST